MKDSDFEAFHEYWLSKNDPITVKSIAYNLARDAWEKGMIHQNKKFKHVNHHARAVAAYLLVPERGTNEWVQVPPSDLKNLERELDDLKDFD